MTIRRSIAAVPALAAQKQHPDCAIYFHPALGWFVCQPSDQPDGSTEAKPRRCLAESPSGAVCDLAHGHAGRHQAGGANINLEW